MEVFGQIIAQARASNAENLLGNNPMKSYQHLTQPTAEAAEIIRRVSNKLIFFGIDRYQRSTGQFVIDYRAAECGHPAIGFGLYRPRLGGWQDV